MVCITADFQPSFIILTGTWRCLARKYDIEYLMPAVEECLVSRLFRKTRQFVSHLLVYSEFDIAKSFTVACHDMVVMLFLGRKLSAAANANKFRKLVYIYDVVPV